MTVVNNALIVGAGIGGLSLGSLLRRYEIETEIVEITPDRAVKGLGIALQPATLRLEGDRRP